MKFIIDPNASGPCPYCKNPDSFHPFRVVEKLTPFDVVNVGSGYCNSCGYKVHPKDEKTSVIRKLPMTLVQCSWEGIEQSGFYQILISKFGPEIAVHIQRLYGFGFYPVPHPGYDHEGNPCEYGNQTAFWFMRKGFAHAAQIIYFSLKSYSSKIFDDQGDRIGSQRTLTFPKYNPMDDLEYQHFDGVTSKERLMCADYFPKDEGIDTDQYPYMYGEHLLESIETNTICIVESIKTCLFCAALFPNRVWMAACSKYFLSSDRLGRLKKYRLILFPDTDALSYWYDQAQILNQQGFSVSVNNALNLIDILPKSDIADLVFSTNGTFESEDVGNEIIWQENDDGSKLIQTEFGLVHRENPHAHQLEKTTIPFDFPNMRHSIDWKPEKYLINHEGDDPIKIEDESIRSNRDSDRQPDKPNIDTDLFDPISEDKKSSETDTGLDKTVPSKDKEFIEPEPTQSDDDGTKTSKNVTESAENVTESVRSVPQVQKSESKSESKAPQPEYTFEGKTYTKASETIYPEGFLEFSEGVQTELLDVPMCEPLPAVNYEVKPPVHVFDPNAPSENIFGDTTYIDRPRETYFYDVESLPNLFTIAFLRLRDLKWFEFKFWNDDVSDREALLELLDDAPILVGYNNASYDSRMLDFLLKFRDTFDAAMMRKFNNKIFAEYDNPIDFKGDFPSHFFDNEKVCRQVDMMMVLGTRGQNLKELCGLMGMDDISDTPIAFDQMVVSGEEVISLQKYNRKDVIAVKLLWDFGIGLIKMRASMIRDGLQHLVRSYTRPGQKTWARWQPMYRHDAAVGKAIFRNFLFDEYGTHSYDYRPTMHEVIEFSDIITDKLMFRDPQFQVMLDVFKSQKMTLNMSAKGNYNKPKSIVFIHKDVHYKLGIGGIHGVARSGVYESDEENVIITVDVAHYYPRIILVMAVCPLQFTRREYLSIIAKMIEVRAQWEKGTPENWKMKIVLNAIFGLTGQDGFEEAFIGDEKAFCGITVNGQLLLMDLVDKLIAIGAQIIAVNTDGVEYRIARNKLKTAEKVMANWEKRFDVSLEVGEYSRFVLRDVNNYFAYKASGKVKCKGQLTRYEDVLELRDPRRKPLPAIVPDAVFNHFIRGIPVERTIYDCTDPMRFLSVNKISKDAVLNYYAPNGDFIESPPGMRAFRGVEVKKGGIVPKRKTSKTEATLSNAKLVKPMLSVAELDIDEINKRHYVELAYKHIKTVNSHKLPSIPRIGTKEYEKLEVITLNS